MQAILVLVLVACCADFGATTPPTAADSWAPSQHRVDAVAARMHLSPDQAADVWVQARATLPNDEKARNLSYARMKAEARGNGSGDYVPYQRLLAAARDGKLDAFDDDANPRDTCGAVYVTHDRFGPPGTLEFDPLFH